MNKLELRQRRDWWNRAFSHFYVYRAHQMSSVAVVAGGAGRW